MRTAMLALVVAVGLAPEAWAQAAPDTARQAEAPGRAASASTLKGYAMQLQEAESRLRQAKEAAARAPEQRQEGAVSQERGELARAGQAALRDLQSAPSGFADTEAYQQAERRFQQNLTVFSASQHLDKDRTIAGAEQALQTLAELRQKVAGAADAAGGSTPTPPAAVSGSGTNR